MHIKKPQISWIFCCTWLNESVYAESVLQGWASSLGINACSMASRVTRVSYDYHTPSLAVNNHRRSENLKYFTGDQRGPYSPSSPRRRINRCDRRLWPPVFVDLVNDEAISATPGDSACLVALRARLPERARRTGDPPRI
jgi:hypothetical protein